MPLLWLSLAFLGGILLAHSFAIPAAALILLAGLAIVLLFSPVSRRLSVVIPPALVKLTPVNRLTPARFFPLLLLCFSLGSVRYLLYQPKWDASFIAFYNDRPTELLVEGVVTAPPDQRNTYINLRLKVERLIDPAQPSTPTGSILVTGALLARVPIGTQAAYGDRVSLQGHLVTPSENDDFSYRDYLANHGIYSYMAYPSMAVINQAQASPIYAAILWVRERAVNLVNSLYSDPEASLISGIVLGVQSGIPQDVQEAFRLTGTSHIVVISGFNITIVALVFGTVFSRLFGKRWGALIATIGIIFYTLLVGAGPAVLRAAFLGLLTLFGHQLGRRQTGVNSLAFAAAILALVTPTILWDVSFQLSFAATLGIMLYAEPLTHWFARLAERYTPPMMARRVTGVVSAYILLTLAAQLTTLPLMAYYFKRISLTALITNPLILPAQPPLMILGGLSILAGLLFQPLGQLIAWAAWPFATFSIRSVEWLATVPHGSLPTGKITLVLILLFYVILFSITFARSKIARITHRFSPGIPLACLALLAFVVWRSGFDAPDNRLHVTILDVGTGDAVLIKSPTGRHLLVNGGPSTLALSDALGRRLPLFDHTLEWLVVADIDTEDIAAIAGNLERFPPTNVLWAGNLSGTRTVADLQTQLINLALPITTMEPGQTIDLGSGVTLRVLSTNPRGAELILEWGNFRMLLPMGMDFTALDSLQRNTAMRNISTVLLPESGYAPVNPPELIAFLHPQLAILSVAAGDKSGLPSPETLKALDGYNLLRTDHNGWIEITTDGSQMWVEVRNSNPTNELL